MKNNNNSKKNPFPSPCGYFNLRHKSLTQESEEETEEENGGRGEELFKIFPTEAFWLRETPVPCGRERGRRQSCDILLTRHKGTSCALSSIKGR